MFAQYVTTCLVCHSITFLTRVIEAEVFVPRVLLPLGPQVHEHRGGLVGTEQHPNHLFPCPQTHRLEGKVGRGGEGGEGGEGEEGRGGRGGEGRERRGRRGGRGGRGGEGRERRWCREKRGRKGEEGRERRGG